MKTTQLETKLVLFSDGLEDFCIKNGIEFMSADDLLYESDTQTMDCHTKLTSDQQDWLSCYINVWDTVVNQEV